MAEIIKAQWVDLEDGRRVRVLAYDDRSIRFRVVGGAPYAIEEAFLSRGKHDHAIVKLVPR
jgi:hypothetical protein